MKPKSVRTRALAAGVAFAEKHHGKPYVHQGKRYATAAYALASDSYIQGWIAGFRAGRVK